MPTWLAIVLIALLALIVGLAVAGAIAQRRRLRAGSAAFAAGLEQVNRDLAAAHATDRGWEPSGLEAAARQAFAAAEGREPERLQLVQVIDRPGTEDDKAVFQVDSEGVTRTLRLGRHGVDWVFEDLA